MCLKLVTRSFSIAVHSVRILLIKKPREEPMLELFFKHKALHILSVSMKIKSTVFPPP